MVRLNTLFRIHAVMLCMLIVLIPTAARAVTPTGTQITAFAEAECLNPDGTPADTTVSQTITVNVEYPTRLSIGGAKQFADGQFVELAETIAVAGTPEMQGAFYIESDDRSAGIRVKTDGVVNEGDLVVVSGTMGAENGERQITAAGVRVISSANPLPETLMLASRHTGGLDTSGLLIRIFGRITAAPSGEAYVYVDDGAGLRDGSGNTGIRVYGTAPANSVGKFVSVTGISGIESPLGEAVRVIRTRRSGDISPVPDAP